MRTALLVLSIAGGALVLPARAAYVVELTTGETLTVGSYWRDGDDVHLARGGGLEIIVKASRIKRIEAGAPEPELGLESASARRSDRVEPAPAPEGDGVAVESMAAYGERLDAMTAAELAAEEERATNALLAAQKARFEAKYGGRSAADVAQLRQRFRAAQARERVVESRLKARTSE